MPLNERPLADPRGREVTAAECAEFLAWLAEWERLQARSPEPDVWVPYNHEGNLASFLCFWLNICVDSESARNGGLSGGGVLPVGRERVIDAIARETRESFESGARRGARNLEVFRNLGLAAYLRLLFSGDSDQRIAIFRASDEIRDGADWLAEGGRARENQLALLRAGASPEYVRGLRNLDQVSTSRVVSQFRWWESRGEFHSPETRAVLGALGTVGEVGYTAATLGAGLAALSPRTAQRFNQAVGSALSRFNRPAVAAAPSRVASPSPLSGLDRRVVDVGSAWRAFRQTRDSGAWYSPQQYLHGTGTTHTVSRTGASVTVRLSPAARSALRHNATGYYGVRRTAQGVLKGVEAGRVAGVQRLTRRLLGTEARRHRRTGHLFINQRASSVQLGIAAQQPRDFSRPGTVSALARLLG